MTAVAPPLTSGPRAALPGHLGLLARRSVLRVYRQPAQFVVPMVIPALLLLINGEALAPSTNLPGFPGDSYRAFWLGNTFVFGASNLATILGANMARDIETGFLQRLTLTPISGVSLLVGHLASAVVVSLVNGAVYLLVGALLGVQLESGVLGLLAIMLLGVLAAVSFGATGTYIALRVGTADAVEGLFPIFFVILFLSSANFPRPLIDTDWFRAVATANPMSYVIEGLRSLVVTGWDATALGRGFGVATVLAVLSVALAARAIRHRLARV